MKNHLRDKNPAAVALGKLGGLKGGKARANALTKEERSAIAKKAALARWNKLYIVYGYDNKTHWVTFQRNDEVIHYLEGESKKQLENEIKNHPLLTGYSTVEILNTAGE